MIEKPKISMDEYIDQLLAEMSESEREPEPDMINADEISAE